MASISLTTHSGSPMITSSSTHQVPKATVVSHADRSAMTRFIEALASSFGEIEPTKSFSAEGPGIPSTFSNYDRVLRYINDNVRDAARDGAMLVEAGEMSAVAVWESLPHAERASNAYPIAQPGPLKREWMDKVKAAKQRHIGFVRRDSLLRPHYQLEFLGRNPNVPSVPGAISAVVHPFLEQARKEGAIVWLEAISPRVVDIYEHFGFRVVEKITIGEVKIDSGLVGENIAGIPAWAMIYDPRLHD